MKTERSSKRINILFDNEPKTLFFDTNIRVFRVVKPFPIDMSVYKRFDSGTATIISAAGDVDGLLSSPGRMAIRLMQVSLVSRWSLPVSDLSTNTITSRFSSLFLRSQSLIPAVRGLSSSECETLSTFRLSPLLIKLLTCLKLSIASLCKGRIISMIYINNSLLYCSKNGYRRN